MAHLKFDIAKLERLNDRGRFDTLPPAVFWDALGAPEAASTIVEIGSGTGLFAAEFARLASHATVYAVDIEEPMIEWMRENRPEVRAGRIVPVLAEETRVPLESDMADIVYTVNLHHELADPAGSYAEALRVLAPGGRFMAADWARVDSPKGPPIAVRADPEEVASLLGDVGYVDVRIRPGALPYAWLLTARKAADPDG